MAQRRKRPPLGTAAPAVPCAGAPFEMVYRDGTSLSLASYQHDTFPLIVHTFRTHNETLLHTHPFIEIVYVRSGTALHEHGSHRYPLFAGDCFVVGPEQAHGFAHVRNFSLTNVLFYPDMLSGWADDFRAMRGVRGFLAVEPLLRAESNFRHKLHLDSAQQREMVTLLDRLQLEFDARATGYRTMCMVLLNQMVVLLGRWYEQQVAGGAGDMVLDAGDRLIERAVAYLEQHAHGSVSARQVAREAYVSLSTLSHAFKRHTGKSLSEYVTSIRIDHACELLRSSSDSVSRISSTVGFQDPAYFSRVFSRAMGVSPVGYRRNRP